MQGWFSIQKLGNLSIKRWATDLNKHFSKKKWSAGKGKNVEHH
jgi:hypothetical protein